MYVSNVLPKLYANSKQQYSDFRLEALSFCKTIASQTHNIVSTCYDVMRLLDNYWVI